MILSWLVIAPIVPLACGVIGWATNVIAVKMLFRPAQPAAVLGLRFQGVMPKYFEQFARQLAEVITGDLLTTSEMVAKVDVRAVYEQLRGRIGATFDQLAEELRQLLSSGQRALVTDEVMESIRAQLFSEIEDALPEVRDQLRRRADELVDLTDLLDRRIRSLGPPQLERMIYRVAHRELRFIEIYGGVFGLAIGLIQLAVIVVLPLDYGLPVLGAAIGGVTNYLAIQMLFFPREPRRYGPVKLHGLFPRRQQEIATAQAKIAAEELILVDDIFSRLRDKLIPGQLDQEMMAQVEDELRRRYPAIAATVETLLREEQQEQFKELLARRFVELAPQVADEVIRTSAAQIDVEQLMERKVATLPRLRFEQLLRTLFKQEEVYLVIYGAGLGATMGMLQLMLVLALG